MAKARVSGDREIRANIRRAMNSVGGRALDQDLRASLQPMKEETEANARTHRQPGNPPGGHLDQGVVIAKRVARGPLFREYWLTFHKRARKIAHLVEYGTAPHWQPNRGVMHPGARPFPFARPAFESTKEEVADIYGRLAWGRISGSLIGIYRK